MLAGLLQFIPLVGPLVVALGARLVASFHSVGQAVVVLLFLGILRIAQDYVIYPRLIGRGIYMHPLAAILAILCGAELAGVAGIFLAIPVVAVLSVIHRHWRKYRGSAGLVAISSGGSKHWSFRRPRRAKRRWRPRRLQDRPALPGQSRFGRAAVLIYSVPDNVLPSFNLADTYLLRQPAGISSQ